MARTKIPYEYFREFIAKRYPRPAFQSHFLVKDYAGRQGITPVRAYDRSSGNYTAIGWFVEVQVSILEGINDEFLDPLYRNRRELIFIPDE